MAAGKYASPEDFRKALESLIKKQATTQGDQVRETASLRKHYAWTALLARMEASPHDFLLKGAYALNLRFGDALRTRPTKDMDFVVRRLSRRGLASTALSLSVALDEIGRIDLGDFFNFKILGEPKQLPSAGDGSWRFNIEAKIGPRRFELFHVDIAAGDAWPAQKDQASIGAFQFAGLGDVDVNIMPKAQHYAEKLWAMTQDRGNIDNNRVKDLVDMVLLIRSGLNTELVARACSFVFKHRKKHAVPAELPPFPASWPSKYEAMAKDIGLEPSYDEAVRLVSVFHDQMAAVKVGR